MSSDSGDSLKFDSRYFKFQTRYINSNENALKDAKKLINNSLKRFDENTFIEEAIECVGYMSIYDINLDELEEDLVL